MTYFDQRSKPHKIEHEFDDFYIDTSQALNLGDQVLSEMDVHIREKKQLREFDEQKLSANQSKYVRKQLKQISKINNKGVNITTKDIEKRFQLESLVSQLSKDYKGRL